MLFTKRKPIDGAKMSKHSSFEYLEGSTRPVMEEVRSKVGQWWDNFPPSEKQNIKRRLMADQVSFSSAMFELVVHETLIRAGHTVAEVEPKIVGTSKRPDFKMRDPAGQEYILELTEARDQNKKEASSAKLRLDIQERISAIGSGDFFVDVWWFEEPKSLDGIGNQIERIKRWMHGLDYEKETSRGISNSTARAQRPSITVENENYRFELSAYPRHSRKAPGSPCLGMNTDGVKESTSEEALKSSIKTKAGRYGDLGMPYFIAINIHNFAIDIDSEVGSLFGPIQFVIERNPETKAETKKYWEYSGDGQFSRNGKSINTRVTGVWIFRNVSLFGGGGRKSCIYYHPETMFPMNLDIDTETFRVSSDGSSERSTGKSMNALLGLEDDWPQMD